MLPARESTDFSRGAKLCRICRCSCERPAKLDKPPNTPLEEENMNAAHVGATLAFLLAVAPASAQNVKITPIGSHPGELCADDRAILFEDPTGVRFLYDPGATATGGNNPRLWHTHRVRVFGEGAGPKPHPRRSRRGQERRPGHDPRDGWLRPQQGEYDPRQRQQA